MRPFMYWGWLPPSSGDIDNFMSQRLVIAPPRPSSSSSTLPLVSAIRHARLGRFYWIQGVRAGSSAGYPVSGPGENLPQNLMPEG